MYKYLIVLSMVLISQSYYGQCYKDRHNTSSASNWVSCEKTASPNPIRGNSFWINYDFEDLRRVENLHIWNINHPEMLTDGASQIAIDYSQDGINWNSWGIWEVGQATASGFYEGETGPDLEGLVTRHLLLTILDNYGGECYGFGEIRIGLDENIVSTTDLEEELGGFEIYPNPADAITTIKIQSLYSGAATIELLDLAGRNIRTDDVTLVKGVQEIRMTLENVISGQYVVRIVTPQSEISTELTVTKTK